MNPREIDSELIKKVKEKNDKLEEFFSVKKEEWTKKLEPIYEVLRVDLKNPSNLRVIIETQSDILSYRHTLNEHVSYFLNKISKAMTTLKTWRADKFIYYATGYGLKTNTSEKTILIDAHVAEWERGIELIQTHIEFLRDTSKNLESIQFAIKNMVSLIEYLGK